MDQKWYGEVKHSIVPKCSPRRLAFVRRCGCCRVILTVQGANAPPRPPATTEAWLHCKYHVRPGKEPGPSMWERTARDYVEAVAADGLVATESRMLGSAGATDLLFRVLQPDTGKLVEVAVEVDGETHFKRPFGGGSQQERQDVDRRRDAAAWDCGLPHVRLHHRDSALWGAALQAAQRLAGLPYLQAFAIYTPSYAEYACTTRVQYNDGRIEELSWDQVGGPLALNVRPRQPLQSLIQ